MLKRVGDYIFYFTAYSYWKFTPCSNNPNTSNNINEFIQPAETWMFITTYNILAWIFYGAFCLLDIEINGYWVVGSSIVIALSSFLIREYFLSIYDEDSVEHYHNVNKGIACVFITHATSLIAMAKLVIMVKAMLVV